MIKRSIPSSGEMLPVIGLGTWQTFDVAPNSYPALNDVLATMHTAGATLIDSSPMYGRAEQVVGDITSALSFANDLFTPLKFGQQVYNKALHKWRHPCKDATNGHRSDADPQPYGLENTFTTIAPLEKKLGKIRYIGITHYTDASHEELEKILIAEKPDFVQFNYSIAARNAEKRLLDVAAANGVATLINRPFGEGKLFNAVKGKPLPEWVHEIGVDSWAAFFLKYIIAHPAVTCVIPATGNPAHVMDNLKAGEKNLPGAKARQKMVEYLNDL